MGSLWIFTNPRIRLVIMLSAHHFVFFTLEASVPPSIRNLPRSIIHIQTIHKYIQAMAIHGIYVQRYSTIRGHRKCCQCEIVASTNYQLPITYPGLLTSPHIQPPVGTHSLPGEELHANNLQLINKPSNFNHLSPSFQMRGTSHITTCAALHARRLQLNNKPFNFPFVKQVKPVFASFI